MKVSGIEQIFWAVSFAGNLSLLMVLFLRRRAGAFPAFTSLISFYVARSIVLFLILHLVHDHTQRVYFYSYLWMAWVDEALQVVIFYELARDVFCPTGVWVRDVRGVFVWMVAGSGVVAALLSFLASPAVAEPIQTVLLRSNFFTSALMGELFVGMLALSVTAGLPWKTHVARIAQGFGTYALISVLLDTVNSYVGLAQGHDVYYAISYIRGLTYEICVGYWLVTLWRVAPAPRELPEQMLTQIYTLQRRVELDLAKIRTWGRL